MADTGLQPTAIAISIAAPCVAFVFVLLRLYSRYFITRNLGWDDGLIVVPMILAIAQAYTTVMGKRKLPMSLGKTVLTDIL